MHSLGLNDSPGALRYLPPRSCIPGIRPYSGLAMVVVAMAFLVIGYGASCYATRTSLRAPNHPG